MNSNRKLKNLICVVLIVALIFSLTACGDGEPAFKGHNVVLTFAGENISLGEVYLYANTVIEDYESVYGNEIWSTDISISRDATANMEDVTRRDIIDNIVHIKLLKKKAPEYKVALSDDEMNEVIRATDSFYEKLTDDQLEEMELDYDTVKKVMEENAIAKRVYDEIIGEADIEVSDEEARETTFYDLYFECYAVASSGDVTEFSEDEKAAQYERALQAYNTLINPIESTTNDGTSSKKSNSMNIEGLAEYYGLKNSSYYTMTPSEIEGIYGKDICDSLYGLEDGSYSLVTESEYGYHIFYMKELTDRDATDNHKLDIITSKKNSYMEELYAEWLPKIDNGYSYEKSVDFGIYNRIEF
ncbi:SurA N-terminal domain-containing protein [Lachnospiraceae bacterium NE2001]|nr:SurA N-terminal domain-containing protein [Lachnospiraceae bacterium NE2001]